MLRVIRLTKPRWVIAENVRGLFTMQNGMVFEQVCLDLENSGYEIQPFIIPAVAVNAPHRRDRIWFVAHAVGDTADRKKKSGKLSEASGKQKQVRAQHGSARQSLRTAFGGRGERFEKNSLVAAAFGNAEGARQSSGDERQGKTQYGRTSSGSDKCVASDTESERKRRVAGKERGIEKRTMAQSKSKRSEIRCESKRCIGHASHSERDGYAERYQKAGRKKRSGKKRWVFKFDRKSWERSWLEVATELCGVDDGLSAELDGLELSKSRHRIERLKALGNAIGPQVAIETMRAIRKTEESIGDT
jgi:DNA (cytosine-5)-methyltransferase 1